MVFRKSRRATRHRSWEGPTMGIATALARGIQLVGVRGARAHTHTLSFSRGCGRGLARTHTPFAGSGCAGGGGLAIQVTVCMRADPRKMQAPHTQKHTYHRHCGLPVRTPQPVWGGGEAMMMTQKPPRNHTASRPHASSSTHNEYSNSQVPHIPIKALKIPPEAATVSSLTT
jgi:hypothetical protein